MTLGISIIFIWIIAGFFSILEAYDSKTNRIALWNYIICLGTLIFCLFDIFILKA